MKKKKKSLSDTWRLDAHDLAGRQDCRAQAALSHLRCLPRWFFSVTMTEPGGGVVWRTGEKGRCWCACPRDSRSARAWKCCKNHLRVSVFYFRIRRIYFCSYSKWIISCYVMIKPLNELKELRNRAKSDEFSRISRLKFKTFMLRKYSLEFGCVMITPQHDFLLPNSPFIAHYLLCLSSV